LGGAYRRAAGVDQEPTASRAGGTVKIEFAVDRETDVTVHRENARGETCAIP